MHGFAIHAAGKIFECITHEQRWNGACVFDVLDAAINAAARFRQGFAVLTRNALTNAIEVFLDELTVAEKQTGSFHRWRLAPSGKSRRRSFYRFINDVRAAHRHFGNRFSTRWIEYR